MSNRYPLGQPILVGHHSERRHRRDIERAHDAADAAARPTAPPRRRRPRPTPPATPQTTGTTPLASPAESTPSRRTSAKHIATSTDTPAPSRPRRPESGSPRPPRPRQALRRPAARQHRTPDNPDSVLEGCPRRSDRRGDSPLHPRRRHPGDLVKVCGQWRRSSASTRRASASRRLQLDRHVKYDAITE